MAALLYSVVLGLLGCILLVDSNCPDGWITHQTSCYFFSHDLEDWPGAITMCSIVGGQLLEIENGQEGHYLYNQVRLYGGDFWMGLTDVMEEGSWMWLNSKVQLMPGNYSHWGKGQPDNHNHDQNCAYLSQGSGQWFDGPCHTARKYICEKDGGTAEIVG